MRFAVIETIYKQALKDDRIYFLTGDLSHACIAEFERDLPDRYINVGIAEQNMVGIAAGLALSGKKVFVYSIIPFITMRCFEQIRDDVCYQNIDVSIIGVGAGYAYGTAGGTHHAIEDIAVMRALPNMTIYSPSNPVEATILTTFLMRHNGPAYLRIGKGGEAMPQAYIPITPHRASIVKEGDDATLFATGTILSEAIAASRLLEKKGIHLEVVNIHTIKPLDDDSIIERIKTRKALFTLEEHTVIGGLGGAVAEVISENVQNRPILFRRFGVPDTFTKKIGSQQYLRDYFSLSAQGVAKTIEQLWKKWHTR